MTDDQIIQTVRIAHATHRSALSMFAQFHQQFKAPFVLANPRETQEVWTLGDLTDDGHTFKVAVLGVKFTCVMEIAKGAQQGAVVIYRHPRLDEDLPKNVATIPFNPHTGATEVQLFGDFVYINHEWSAQVTLLKLAVAELH